MCIPQQGIHKEVRLKWRHGEIRIEVLMRPIHLTRIEPMTLGITTKRQFFLYQTIFQLVDFTQLQRYETRRKRYNSNNNLAEIQTLTGNFS